MKILSSSPYATFSPKEWSKAARPYSSLNATVRINRQKVYFQNSRISISKKVLNKNDKNSNFIQLSFA